MKVSIIIPTLNENSRIGSLCTSLRAWAPDAEIIVADGHSRDGTAATAIQAGASVIQVDKPSRSRQMNAGAAAATGELLYFVHADVQLQEQFIAHLTQAVRSGHLLGGYQYRFDSGHPLLKINSFFTRFPFIWCRGGDQTLFITREVFDKLNGFADMPIMEDYDLLARAGKMGFKYHILPYKITVSARKYQTNGYLKVQWANLQIMRAWKREGKGTEEMLARYRRFLNPW